MLKGLELMADTEKADVTVRYFTFIILNMEIYFL